MNRNLKVGYNTRDNGTRYTRHTKFFPKIILQGNWLQNAGFNIGDETEVTVKPGKIEIALYQQAAKAAYYEAAYQDFISYLDNIFYEGYAIRLATDQPQQFNNELNQFLNNYHYENI